MFAGKAPIWYPTGVRSGLASKYYATLNKRAKDKQPSLFCRQISDEEKKRVL
jgi:hypothetical protein